MFRKAFKPHSYIKDESFDPIFKPLNKRFLWAKVYPIGFVSLGFLLLLTQVVIPLVWFKTADTVSRPVSSSVLGVASGFRDFEFAELEKKEVLGDSSEQEDGYFYLTVPKLGIKKAAVEINAPSLNPEESLGHYKGSALPGNVGNAFVYGHSVLPWFFNPKNYKTIFSTLDRLVAGDVFYVEYEGEEFKYEVDDIIVAVPEAVEPLADMKPRFLNASTVTLMTCVPPGTKLKRLLVVGDLVD